MTSCIILNMNNSKYIIILLFILSGICLFAQSNEIIDDILTQEKLSCGNGAYLALTAGRLISDSATREDALIYLQNQGWINNQKEISDEMSLGEYSLAVMKTFRISGGLMYTFFPSARYASRELGYLGYISQDAGAYRKLSGSEAISIIGQITRSQGE